MSLQTREAGLALLKWYVDAGADEAVGIEAAALYAAAEANVTPLHEAAQVSLRPHVAKPPTAEEEAARLTGDAVGLAASCNTLEELRAALETFEAKAQFPAARNLVFADGNPGAPVMFIGEAPGEQEDRQGLPFVGRSGQLLDRMLGAIGLDRSSVYITNILPWRPMANRTPTLQEGVIFLPFLMRHIELAAPRLTVALGGSSAKLLLDTNQGIMRLRGTWSELDVGKGAGSKEAGSKRAGSYGADSKGAGSNGADSKGAGSKKVPLLPTLHPAYLLRNPLAKREAWVDLLNLKQRLGAL